MPQVRFEPKIPVFERAKIVRALERATTLMEFVISSRKFVQHEKFFFFTGTCRFRKIYLAHKFIMRY
jgi:hypothetical protein